MYLSSGIGVYLQNLLPRIAQIIPQEKMTLLCSAAVAERLRASLPRAGLRILKSGIYSLREQLELMRHAPSGGGVWWSPHFNVPVAYAGKLVVTIHDLFHLTSREVRRSPVKLAYARVMFGAVRRHAHKVICVSRFTAGEFERLVGAKGDQIEVVHNGLDENWLTPVSGPRIQERPYFLFVGNFKPNKNIGGLIRAFAAISSRVPHDLVIVGKRSGFITGDRNAERLAETVGPRVKFTGFVDQESLRRWYRDAAALVFPSFYEGFGFPPLEAMAVECPVVASNAASLPEVCGDAVLYCDPADPAQIGAAMLRVMRDPDLRASLAAKGRVRATAFRWSDTAKRTAAILQAVMRKAQ
jgi:glycosyltransferase involved in cell wall biosynthesis